MKIEIKTLDNSDEDILDLIAAWYSNWWTNNKTKEEIKCELLNSSNILLTRVAYFNNEVVGACQLLIDDNIGIKKYTPYLANLFVRKDMRGKKVGESLILDMINEAKNMGYDRLYLHSKHIGLYEKYGFTFFEEIKLHNKTKRMYYINLNK